ncbi:PAS domain-containing hybrid sensor histidine kinase/response regulator [Horticoccus sp. 23ND18S-11]|uniref:PAS domain-containing hybrid sensor histidine kinase/response regulator n=1 Tax=Horticoccus sp. 23ND18S-11 TaxID=3391832 RepID=UPI0039C8F2D5
MSEIDSSPHSENAPTRSPGLSPDLLAVLVLDAVGRIIGSNASAHRLWQPGDAGLKGQPFVSLFVFEVAAAGGDVAQAQWESLLSRIMGGETVLTAAPRQCPPCDVRVRLEPHLSGAGGYIATIRPAPEPVARPAAATEPAGVTGQRLLTESSTVGFFELNLAARTAQFSPSWKRLLGYAPAELADTLETWQSLIHPDDTGAAPDTPGRRGTGGPRPFSVEFRMRHQRGHWIWMQCAGVQVLNTLGVLERVVGVHVDITERKELEDSLAANDARLHDLSGSGPLGAFELDFVHRVFWFSPAFERLLGYDEGELARKPESFAAVLPDEEAPNGTEPWILARAPGQTTFAEAVRLRAKDGRPVSVIIGAHRSLNRKRELVRVVGFICPLPAGRVVDPDALPSQVTGAAFNTLGEAVIVTDASGRIVFANAGAHRLLNLDPAAVRGQPLGDVFRLVQRQSLRPGDNPIHRALAADRPLPLIADDALSPSTPDAPPRPIVWTARAVPGDAGEVQGVVVVFRDPAEMTLTPDELVKVNRLESLGLIAGGIAHDFNNLLTTILGGISIARDIRDYVALGDAEKACIASKALTKQLLAFARGGVGAPSVHLAHDILDDAIKIGAAGSPADISLHVSEGTDPVLVDRAQMLQVFQNLIINALQAMPPPPHRARVQIHASNVALTEQQVPGLAAGDYVEFEVRDNGGGIKPEHVDKIFDPFFTTKKHGTGLGLATVLSVVRKHGGQIGLDTQLGVGTAITVYLPKAEKPLELQAQRAVSLRFGTGRVLFMDDDPAISALTARMLDNLGYKYDLAKDGEEAVALYKRYLNIGRPYDAVIVDLNVVGAMGGEECFTNLKALDPEVRAIVSSGYDNDDIARRFLAQGFCGYLTKPYRVGDLGKVLKTVLG